MLDSGSVWESNQSNSNEDFWQETLLEHQFVLGHLFATPIVIIDEKAYVGGKTFENRQGKLVDFLLAKELTGNAVLAELKTPTTQLTGSEYRNGIFKPSSELTGAIVQAQTYRQSLVEEYHQLEARGTKGVSAFNPQCLVIAGNVEREFDDGSRQRSFELFRGGLRNVRVVGYDELFQKVVNLVKILESELD